MFQIAKTCLGLGSFCVFFFPSLVFFPSPKLIIPFFGVNAKVMVFSMVGDSFSCLSNVIKMETQRSQCGVYSSPAASRHERCLGARQLCRAVPVSRAIACGPLTVCKTKENAFILFYPGSTVQK